MNGGTRATATHRMTIDVSTSSLATVAPSVTGVEIEPEANNASWDAGETVEGKFTFDEAVTVDTAGGVPAVSLTLGASTQKSAPYLRGSGTTELVFGYTVAKGEGPYDSALLAANSLALNGGAIRSTESSADAALAHDGFAVIGGPTSRGVAKPGPTARSADPFGVDTIEASRQLLQRRVHQSPDRSKRMVLGNPGLQRYVAEDPTLGRLRSSHISPLGLPSKVPFDEEFFSSLLGARSSALALELGGVLRNEAANLAALPEDCFPLVRVERDWEAADPLHGQSPFSLTFDRVRSLWVSMASTLARSRSISARNSSSSLISGPPGVVSFAHYSLLISAARSRRPLRSASPLPKYQI